ncbi:MAG: PEP-CTERM sorting domain-containing protein [Verrucomicrobiota bacterium]
MTSRIAPLLGGLFCATAMTLSAQTFTLDDSAPFDVNTYRHTNDFAVGEIIFNNGTGKATDPYSINPVSLKETVVTLASGEVTVYDVCAEMFVGPTGSSTYSVSGGLGSLTSTQQLEVRKLFSNTLGDFIAAQAISYNDASIVGAAIQLALWEIVEDPLGVSTPSLDEDNANAGQLSIDGFNTGPPNYTGTTRSAIDQAEIYLTALRNDTWVDEGGFNYYYADATSEQDRIWVTAGINVIPEPSTALLSLVGFAFVLRRRRH